MKAAIELIQNIGLLALLAYVLVALKVGEKITSRILISKAIIGAAYGLMCAVVMIDPIVIPFGATLDPRAGPAVMAGVVGGLEAAVIANAIGAIVRYYVIGGPVAVGGVVGFLLYAVYGWLVGQVIKTWNVQLNIAVLTLIGIGSVIIVLPSFFISADPATAFNILGNAWPYLLTANMLGIIVVGLVTAHAYRTVNLNERLQDKNRENEMLGLALRSSNPVIITNRAGVTEWVNEGFTKLTGYSAEEIVGRKPGQLLQGPQTSLKTIELMRHAIANGIGFDVEIVNYSKAGLPYWVSLSCSPIKIGSETVKFVAIQNDISERIEAATSMRLAKEEAEAANRAKSEFLATMSHELRTPLNAILGFSQLLQMDIEKRLSDKQTAYVEHVLSSGEHLLQLINDILDLSQIEADRLPIQVEVFEAIDTIKDCEAKLLPMAQKNNVAIAVKPFSGALGKIRADQFRFRQVVINLLSNAIKYNKPGGTVTIEMSIPTDGFQRILITDTGKGIPANKRDRLFKYFSRINTNPNLAGSGAGLGLAVSKMLVDRMGGHIGFSSTENVGSTFWVEMPLADNDHILVWDEDLRVGIDAIDFDHQRILTQINKLSDPDVTEKIFAERLGDLVAFIEQHFRREETIMSLCDFPQFEEHALKHRSFIEDLKKLERRWLVNADPDLSHQIRATLCDWWNRHIRTSDKSIMSYAGGKEREIRNAVEEKV